MVPAVSTSPFCCSTRTVMQSEKVTMAARSEYRACPETAAESTQWVCYIVFDSFNAQVSCGRKRLCLLQDAKSRARKQPRIIVGLLQYNLYCLFVITFVYFVSRWIERFRGCAMANAPINVTCSFSEHICTPNGRNEETEMVILLCIAYSGWRQVLLNENENAKGKTCLFFCRSRGINMPMQNTTAAKQSAFKLCLHASVLNTSDDCAKLVAYCYWTVDTSLDQSARLLVVCMTQVLAFLNILNWWLQPERGCLWGCYLISQCWNWCLFLILFHVTDMICHGCVICWQQACCQAKEKKAIYLLAITVFGLEPLLDFGIKKEQCLAHFHSDSTCDLSLIRWHHAAETRLILLIWNRDQWNLAGVFAFSCGLNVAPTKYLCWRRQGE